MTDNQALLSQYDTGVWGILIVVGIVYVCYLIFKKDE